MCQHQSIFPFMRESLHPDERLCPLDLSPKLLPKSLSNCAL
jgi:hypothetical protein